LVANNILASNYKPMPDFLIAPSLLSADFARLGDEVRAVTAAYKPPAYPRTVPALETITLRLPLHAFCSISRSKFLKCASPFSANMAGKGLPTAAAIAWSLSMYSHPSFCATLFPTTDFPVKEKPIKIMLSLRI
jgi:hypothetical protein